MAFPPHFFWALNAFGEEKETPGLFPTGNLGQSHSSALPQGAAREIFPGILMHPFSLLPLFSCFSRRDLHSPWQLPNHSCFPLILPQFRGAGHLPQGSELAHSLWEFHSLAPKPPGSLVLSLLGPTQQQPGEGDLFWGQKLLGFHWKTPGNLLGETWGSAVLRAPHFQLKICRALRSPQQPELVHFQTETTTTNLWGCFSFFFPSVLCCLGFLLVFF